MDVRPVVRVSRACFEHSSLGPAHAMGAGWVWGLGGEFMFCSGVLPRDVDARSCCLEFGGVPGGGTLRCQWHMCTVAQCRTCLAAALLAFNHHFLRWSWVSPCVSGLSGLLIRIKPLCVHARVGVQSCLLLQAPVTHWLCMEWCCRATAGLLFELAQHCPLPVVQFGAALLQVALSCDRVPMVLCAEEHRGKSPRWQLSVPRACTFCTGLHQPRSCTHVCYSVMFVWCVCVVVLRGCTQCAFVHVLLLL